MQLLSGPLWASLGQGGEKGDVHLVGRELILDWEHHAVSSAELMSRTALLDCITSIDIDIGELSKRLFYTRLGPVHSKHSNIRSNR